MPDDPLEERLAAVERAVSDGDGATVVDDRLRDRVDAVEDDVAELEAAVQAVRGYVGGVRHVNDEVQQRADAAMAKAQALERTLADGARPPDDGVPTDPGGRSTVDGSPGATDGRGSPDDEAPPAGEPATGNCPRCGGPTDASPRDGQPADGPTARDEAVGASATVRSGARGDDPDPGPDGRERSPGWSGDAGPGSPGDEAAATGAATRERTQGTGRHPDGVGERRVGEQRVEGAARAGEQASREGPGDGDGGLLARLREVL